MYNDKRNPDSPKRSYVLERMKRITSSSERAVKWVLYLYIASIGITLLGVLWFFIG